jgi:beta-barrel assembly-enhancing protease
MNSQATYRNEQTGQSLACDLTLHEEKLYIYLQDENKSMLIWDLQKVESIRWSGSQLTVKKGNYAGESVLCQGDMAYAIDKAGQEAHIPKKPTRNNRVPLLLFGSAALGLLGVCLLCYFLLLPWVAQQSVALVPVSAEVAIGEQLSRTYTARQAVNDSASWYANRFIHRLKLDNTYPLRVRVIRSPEINAFALPGGNIVMYSGILDKMSSYGELAALVGHEVTHVTHRHSLKSMFRGAASSLLLAAVLGDMAGVTSVLLAKADEFKQLDYSRELETEADDNGLQTLLDNKISPSGMLRLLKLLKAEGAEMPGMMKYLSTHPDTQARIDHLQSKSAINRTFHENEELKALFNGMKRNLSH